MTLRGGESDEEEEFGPGRLNDAMKDINFYRTTDGYSLEPAPQYSLRTADQDEGVDYGAHGFMFNIVAKRSVVITGVQICSADGGPFDYDIYTCPQPWEHSFQDETKWTACGGGFRVSCVQVNIPGHEHGEYGKLPFTDEGVKISGGQTRAFYIHSKNEDTAVGYHLLGDSSIFDGPFIDKKDKNVTERDANILITTGTTFNQPMPFKEAQLDDLYRGFLGIIEYELDH
ncbi:hypothetical protein GUITHDRAFT_134950 [Guillardia theta CCMP2712]|uniref:Uncharacterized protein n=1 Tax=Guillardia theta (strain CCMP2712) TaxID=905079 RepID=L1JRE6_GUITC|nr:hypothetical protein GUITHDRAFT_134950 [Guillardia theta CCMP2712]EKX50844.1 hypothetical protein GUITHDRAFT_134950 [Guillardia theta CCMP2712]|eukprot:XP_005837824.1 hypothetical protein GUITHDRAFT_134950 [Guillardia theta CCMP2712]